MTGEGIKREIGVWSWQETRAEPLHFIDVDLIKQLNVIS